MITFSNIQYRKHSCSRKLIVSFNHGRYGATEFNMIVQALNVRYGRKEDNRKPALCDMCLGPGFFPKNMRLAEKFVDLMLEEIPNIEA